MVWLVLGLALWVGAHVFKRVAPAQREAMVRSMGNGAKGAIAGVLVLAVVLMVVGYRGASTTFLWASPGWTVHLNNLLNLFAFGLFALSHSKSRLRGSLRHPQLIGVSLWCVAHLLVNGDLRSLVLWGVLFAWALSEIAIINAREPAPEPFSGGSRAGDIRLVVITLVVFAVVAAIHAALGVWPFPA